MIIQKQYIDQLLKFVIQMIGDYVCQIKNHNNQKIIGICQNENCKQPARSACLECTQIHQKNDPHFILDNIKNDIGPQTIIDEFKFYKIDIINNIGLQCDILQYLLNLEMIEFIKLWNFKLSKLKDVQQKLIQFKEQQWEQIGIHNYIHNMNKQISIFQYLEKFQNQLLHIDDLKDQYIKSIFGKSEYDECCNDTINQIKKNELFLHRQQNEDLTISICEEFLKQGYHLKTNSLVDFFQKFKKSIIDPSVDKSKTLYIESSSYSYRLNNNYQDQLIAQQLIDKSIEINEKYDKAVMIKGRNYQPIQGFQQYNLTEYDLSIKSLITAASLNRINSNAINYLGLAFIKLNMYEESINMFDLIIKIDPKFLLAYHNKGDNFVSYQGLSLHKMNYYQQAIDMFDIAIKIDPKYIESYLEKARAFTDLKLLKEAIDIYDYVIFLNPNDDNYYNLQGQIITINLGFLYLELKLYDQALYNFCQSINIFPNNENIYKCKGEVHEFLEQYEEAIYYFLQAIQLSPELIYLHGKIGQLYYKLKDFKQAKEQIERISQNIP
ncbi:hypothetical protein pb186bvf_002049 [Paramecium bursaria]